VEYEARTLKWYWVAALIFYAAGCIYLLLRENPLLYSQGTLKSEQMQKKSEALLPWPPPSSQFELEKKSLGPQESWPYLGEGHLNMTSPEVTRNKTYTEFKTYPLKAEFHGKVHVLIQSDQNVYLTDEDGKIYFFDSLGTLQWTYGMDDSSELEQVLLDQALLYLIRKNGTVTTIDISNGRPHWELNTDRPLFGEAWLENDTLILPVKAFPEKDSKKKSKKLSSTLLKIDRRTGVYQGTSEGFDFNEAFHQVKVPHSDLRILYSGADLVAVPKVTDDWKPVWSTTLPENLSGELVIADGQIFAVTESNHLYALNLKKKGDVAFDIDLDIPPGGPLTYLPEMDRIAYLGKNATLRVVDIKKKQMAWKFDLSIKGSLREIWTARLKGAYIQEFGMRWVYKGWTIWSPCREQHFCIYNPERGQLIQRIALSGDPISLPTVYEDRLIVLVKMPSGGLALSHLLDPGELRKAQAKEATETK